MAWPKEMVAVLSKPAQCRHRRPFFAASPGSFEVGEFVAFAAIEALGVGRVAVEFDHLVERRAGILVQVVDVLRDDGADFAGIGQRGDGVVAGVGLRAGPAGGSVEDARPGFAAHASAMRRSPGT